VNETVWNFAWAWRLLGSGVLSGVLDVGAGRHHDHRTSLVPRHWIGCTDLPQLEPWRSSFENVLGL
jgi:hypothetical protein